MAETRICNTCDAELPADEFSWRDKEKGTRQGKCKACHKAYRRQHYLDNHEKYKAKARRWDKENKQKYLDVNRRYILDYLLKNPCVDCGETNPIVLEFDHVRGKKVEPVSVLASTTTSLKRVKAEIAKCEVRCANCHRIKTAKERGWHLLDLMAEYGLET